MGLFSKKPWVPPHPRQEPLLDLPLSLESVEQVLGSCADFAKRELELAEGEKATLCWVDGMVKTERLNDYVLRPLMSRKGEGSLEETVVWNLSAEQRSTMDQVVGDLINGSCALFWKKSVLTFAVPTEEKRSVSPPETESVVKGPKDAFVESVRTNTSLLRRRLRTPFLRVEEQIVGRQSMTPVDVIWVEGVTDPELVEQVRGRIRDIDIDAVLSTGNLEEYVVECRSTPFPQVMFTERPDRFCTGLMDGRVGVLIDGLPMGCLMPGLIAQFVQASQDKSNNYLMASALTLIRYACILVTLFLPAVYVAMATFHFEMIPTKLALSIIASKQDVPFVTAFEVLAMLVAFEILQEAGLRLPQTIGQTVSIIGGLVVGQSAVEAKIVSPVVVIVVAVAGITGYTMPNQDFANALRLWRFVLAVLASLAGLFGMVIGAAALVYHLAGIECLGVAYLTPYAPNAGVRPSLRTLIRRPLPDEKLREEAVHPQNRRNQG